MSQCARKGLSYTGLMVISLASKRIHNHLFAIYRQFKRRGLLALLWKAATVEQSACARLALDAVDRPSPRARASWRIPKAARVSGRFRRGDTPHRRRRRTIGMARFHPQPPSGRAVTWPLIGIMLGNPKPTIVRARRAARICSTLRPNAVIFDEGLPFDRGDATLQISKPLDERRHSLDNFR